MLLTVLVPTYRRPKDLARCLKALEKQMRLPDEVLITVRDTDIETRTFLDTPNLTSLHLRIVTVTATGVVAAMNAGLDVAQGDIIAITDDDAAPHPDWLSRIEAYFRADEHLGGVGGRDWLYLGTQLCEADTHPGASQKIGRLMWFGKVIGNHHIGRGEPREVDVLKGVNSSYRRIALEKVRFDDRLLGTGAQVYWELALCLKLKRLGWKLIYDPAIAVDHYLAPRFDEDLRFKFNSVAFFNEVHNETLIIIEHFPLQQKIIFVLWAIFVGTRRGFGLAQLLRFLPTEGKLALEKWSISLRARLQGYKTWQRSNYS